MVDHKFNFIIGPKLDDVFQFGEYIIPLDEWTISHHSALGIDYNYRSLRHYTVRSPDDWNHLRHEQIPHDLIWNKWISGQCLVYDKLCVMVTNFVNLENPGLKSHLLVPNVYDPVQKRIPKAESLIKDRVKNERTAVVLVINSDFYMQRAIKEERFIEYETPMQVGPSYVLYYPDYIKKDPRYRIYLGDRLLMERVYDLNIDNSKQCYEEVMLFNKIPAAGFDFKLESQLSIHFLAVEILGETQKLGANVFSYTPDK